MASQHDDYPEVAADNGLSVVDHHHHYRQPWSPQNSSMNSPGPGQSLLRSEVSAHYAQNPNHQGHPAPLTTISLPTKKSRTICGCTTIVFLLSIVIALLSAAIIGLSTGTGVIAVKYNHVNTKLEALHASYNSAIATTMSSVDASTASSSPTPNSYSNLHNGCSDKDEKVTGKTYQTDFFNQQTFTMYCNKDASGLLYSLFASNFNNRMSACASWNYYNSTRSSCGGVSYIPL